MGKRKQSRDTVESKIDLRNVMLSKRTDIALDEYIIKQKKIQRELLRGEAGVELIEKSLKAEGLL